MRYFLLVTLAFLVRSAVAQPTAELHQVRNIPAGGAWHMCTSPEGHVYAATIGGLLRYADSTWELITHDSIGDVSSVTTDGKEGLVIGTRSGKLYRSRSRQDVKWRLVLVGLGSSQDLETGKDGVIVAPFTNRVYVSHDYGEIWTTGIQSGFEFRCAGLSNTELIVSGRNPAGAYRTWRSTNSGVTWDTLPYLGRHGEDVIVDKRGNILLAAYDQSVMLSSDHGQSWIKYNDGLGDTVVPTRIVESNDGTLYLSSYGDGVYRRRSDEAAWSPINSGLFESELVGQEASRISYSVALDSNGKLYCSTWSTFAQLSPGQNEWTRLKRGFTAPYTVAMASYGDFGENAAGVFVGGYGTFARSPVPDHSSWMDLIPSIGYDNIRRLFRSYDGRLFAICGSRSVVSSDNGKTWDLYKKDVLSVCESGSSIVTSDHIRNLVSRGADTIYGSYGNSIQCSLDGGKSWSNVDTIPVRNANNTIEGLAIDSRGRLYVQCYYSIPGVFRLDPLSKTIENLSGAGSCVVSLKGPFNGSVAVFSPGKLTIFSGDQSFDWVIPSHIYMCGTSMESRVYVGTQGGVFWLDLYSLAKQSIAENTISAPRLSIFPNPAQSTFTLDLDGVSQVYAIDVLGHHLALKFDPSDKSVAIGALLPGSYVVLANDGKKTYRALLTKY